MRARRCVSRRRGVWRGTAAPRSLLLQLPSCPAECAQAQQEEAGRERRDKEENGIILAEGVGEADKHKSVYYHYASQGERTQDYMFFVRQQLVAGFAGIQYERGAIAP